MRFNEIKNLSDQNLEMEIKKHEKKMKDNLPGNPTKKQVGCYHSLLWMYNEANERKWQKEHKKER